MRRQGPAGPVDLRMGPVQADFNVPLGRTMAMRPSESSSTDCAPAFSGSATSTFLPSPRTKSVAPTSAIADLTNRRREFLIGHFFLPFVYDARMRVEMPPLGTGAPIAVSDPSPPTAKTEIVLLVRFAT